MKTKRRALGKGLRSLIRERPPQPAPKPPVAARPGQGLEQIDLDRISPNPEQPRQQFDQANLEQLAASLRRDGLLQPVVVRPRADGGFELIAGERRWRAAQLAGLMKIPALIRKVGDEQMLELALIENLQRDDLNPLEAAHAFHSLIDDLGLTQEEVAGRVGKKRATISNTLRLLHLPREIQEKIESGELTLGHAKALASLTDSKAQIELATRLVRETLSVRQTEAIVAGMVKGTTKKAPKPEERDPNIQAAEEQLQSAIGTRVRITQGKSGAGKIELHFFSHQEMERVFQLILAVSTAKQP